MPKTIKVALPDLSDAHNPLENVQARCEADLVERTRAALKKQKHTWRMLLESAMRSYLGEPEKESGK